MAYKKLVRDKIPDIIRKNGEKPITRILDDDEYKEELRHKVVEEAMELRNAKNRDETLKELADVSEAIIALTKTYGFFPADLEAEMHTRRLERGGFEGRIYLEGVEK